MTRSIDVRGEICPYPMMKASEALKKLPAGETLEVLTDHAPALTTIPWEAAKHGYRAAIERAGSAEWRVTLAPAAETLSPAELMADLARQLEAAGSRPEGVGGGAE
ncbi:MAG TPA: sulfurtransferase TusA family protein [Chloroflexota bacterium]